MYRLNSNIPDNKVHGANMRPTWVLSAPDGPHVGPVNLAIRDNAHHIATLKYFSSRLAVVFAQSIEARCQVENEDVEAPTRYAPTTSE